MIIPRRKPIKIYKKNIDRNRHLSQGSQKKTSLVDFLETIFISFTERYSK